jgi:stage II sporulation SpoAA-like protein
MGFDFDDRSWPIVKARWSGTVGDQDVDAMLSRVNTYFARQQRFGLLIDSRGGGGLSPEQRQRVLAHMKQQAHLTSRWLVQAVVIDNLIQRTLYYAFRLLMPTPFPSKAFADIQSAEAWLVEAVAAAPASR